jgi:hypothetical protein
LVRFYDSAVCEGFAGAADAMADALMAKAASREAESKTYVARRGYTLWDIATQNYGRHYPYRRLFEATPLCWPHQSTFFLDRDCACRPERPMRQRCAITPPVRNVEHPFAVVYKARGLENIIK